MKRALYGWGPLLTACTGLLLGGYTPAAGPGAAYTPIALAGPVGKAGAASAAACLRDRIFDDPGGLAVDAVGTLYVANKETHDIRRVTARGEVSIVAGASGNGYAGYEDGPVQQALFNTPYDIAVGSDGTLYVADTGNQVIRLITPAGVVSTLAGSQEREGSTDGTGPAARFAGPRGVAVDAAGTVYVADTDNHTIRRISPAGVVSTLAGAADSRGYADGVGAAARFCYPTDVAWAPDGRLYVADLGNHRIRCVTPAGQVTTLAGTCPESSRELGIEATGGYADGPGATARFSSPAGVAVGSSQVVYVAEQGNHTIRVISPAGVVRTLAGAAGREGHRNGLGSAARFAGPTGVAVAASGTLYVSDTSNDLIRRISPAGRVGTLAGTRRPVYHDPIFPRRNRYKDNGIGP